jgi:hypothetical protein
MQDAVLRSPECAFLDCNIADDVNGFHFDMRIGESSEPIAKECGASCFSRTMHTAGRLENDLVGKNFREAVKVMSVEGGCPSFKSLAWGHFHAILLWILQRGLKGRPERRSFARG